MVGHVAHKSNDRAMVGIARNGLRNDYDAKGKQQGRTAIMADPWGATDKCENLYLQRERGDVRIIIAVGVWWEHLGIQIYYHKGAGVSAFIAGVGAVLCANVDAYIATVIPVRVFRGLMMHYPIDGHFSRRMSAAGVQDLEAYGQNLETQYKTESWSRVFTAR
jgi:hypothetical protein